MKKNSVLTNYLFIVLITGFLICPRTGNAQAISATTDTVELEGIPLSKMVDYIQQHNFSMEDYLKKKGFYKNDSNKEYCFHNDSTQSKVYLTVTEKNQALPKSITSLKQDVIVIKSTNKRFDASFEQIINELKNDENFSVEIDPYKGEYSFYSIKSDFYIKILFAKEYELIAIY